MDFEAALISKILKTPDEILKVIDARISADLFVDHPALWDLIVCSYRDHGGLPPEEFIKERFPSFQIVEVESPSSILIDELKKRRVHNLIIEHQTSSTKLLKNKDPYSALEALRQCVIKVENEIRSTNDFSFTDNIKDRQDRYFKAQSSGGVTGIPTPWLCLNEATQGFHGEELIMLAGRGGVGKCVHRLSEIQNPVTGIIKTIEEMYTTPEDNLVLSLDELKGIVSSKVFNKINSGIKRCYKYTIESGREIIVTPEHPFLTPEGWIRADLLDEGDYIGIPTRVPFPSSPTAIPSHEVDMLAVLLSEGGYTGHALSFTSEDKKFVSIAFEAAKGFGCSANQRKNCDITYDFVLPYASSGRWSLNPIRSFLKRLGIDRTLAKNKCIPDCVFSLDADQLARFLGIFWMADGHIDTAPCVTLASKKMVYQLQHLLLRFGIQSSVRYKPAKGGFHAWRLRVYSHCMEDFLRLIPLWGHKHEKLTALVEKRQTVIPNKNVGGSKWRNALPEIKDILWVKIETVESMGEQQVYDLSIENTHCFIANDIVVHNSWAFSVLAWYNWTMGYVPLVFSKEMAVWQIIRRLDAVHAQLPYSRFKSGQLTTDEYMRWEASLQALADKPNLWVIGDEDGMGVTGIAAKIQRYKPSIVYIDGGYLIEDERKARDGWEKFKNVCWDLKKLALREKIPIVMSHQFTKEGKGLEGNADTLKYGDVQMWFDLIIGIYQDEALRNNKEMLFKIAKHREGSTIEWVSDWDLDAMKFDAKPVNDLPWENAVPYAQEGPVDY